MAKPGRLDVGVMAAAARPKTADFSPAVGGDALVPSAPPAGASGILLTTRILLHYTLSTVDRLPG